MNYAACSGVSKNQASFHMIPRSAAALRMACISSSDGAVPVSQRETVPWETPASRAKSACFIWKIFWRICRIALIATHIMRKRIVCKQNLMRKRIFLYPQAVATSKI